MINFEKMSPISSIYLNPLLSISKYAMSIEINCIGLLGIKILTNGALGGRVSHFVR